MNRLPASLYKLLFGSFVFTIGRAVVIPFLTIYLTDRLGVDQARTGAILSASLLCGTLFGLYAGHLVDRFDRRRLMCAAVGIAAISTFALAVSSASIIIVLALAATDAALSLYAIAVKTVLAEAVPAEDRPRAFSLNYTILNVAYATGPVLGAAVIGMGRAVPFEVSATIIALAAGAVWGNRNIGSAAAHGASAAIERPSFRATLSQLRQDRRLLFFTIGGLLSALACRRFSMYLSQYLIVAKGSGAAEAIMPYLLMTNSIAVVLLQYPSSKWIKPHTLLRLIRLGSAALLLGIVGFAFAESLPVWIASMLIFTVGEVIIIPAEYLFIDMIAPPALRGSYYGAQNLLMIGTALTPMLCGSLLTHAGPAAMFGTLIFAVVGGAFMYGLGNRSAHKGGMPTDDVQAVRLTS